ncbi:MAG: hypothetical protein WC261_07910 [Synergistaceae bacterium]|jgi:hypothetical protein
MVVYKGMGPDSCSFALKDHSDKLSGLLTKLLDPALEHINNAVTAQNASELSFSKLTPEQRQALEAVENNPELYAMKTLGIQGTPDAIKSAPLDTDPERLYLNKTAGSTSMFPNIDKIAKFNLARLAATAVGTSGMVAGARTLANNPKREYAGGWTTFKDYLKDPATWMMGVALTPVSQMGLRNAASRYKAFRAPAPSVKAAALESGFSDHYFEEYDKTASAALLSKFVPGAAKYISKMTTKLGPAPHGSFLKRFAGTSALVGGFRTLSDEDMRQKHGILGTFGRKMISPKTWVMGAGGAFAAPRISSAGTKLFGWTGKKIGGNVGNKMQKMSEFFQGKTFDTSAKGIEAAVAKNTTAAGRTLKRDIMRKMYYDAAPAAIKKKMFGGKMPTTDAAWTEFLNATRKINAGTFKQNIKGLGQRAGAETQKQMATPGFQHRVLKQTTQDIRKGVKTNKWGKRLNPFDPFSIAGIGGAMTGVAGPWTPAGAMWEEDSMAYKPFSGKAYDPFANTRKRFT